MNSLPVPLTTVTSAADDVLGAQERGEDNLDNEETEHGDITGSGELDEVQKEVPKVRVV